MPFTLSAGEIFKPWERASQSAAPQPYTERNEADAGQTALHLF